MFEMCLPSWDLEAGHARELGLAIGAVRMCECADTCDPARTVKRIQIVWNIARDLLKHTKVAGQYRDAKRQRLDEGHPVAFNKGWEQQCTRVQQPRAQALVRAVGLFNDGSANWLAALQHVHDVFAFPSAAADDDELWGVFAECFNESPPDVQHEPVILARLDCAEHHEIRMIERAWQIFA